MIADNIISSSDTIACSNFVKRQTKESGFSHFSGTWDDLAILVKSATKNPQNIIPGYRPGVILVKLPGAGVHDIIGSFCFYSGVVKLNPSTKIEAVFEPRMPGESPYIRLGARANKQPAKRVEIVCYRAEVLDEDNDRSTNADWEIISIKAMIYDDEEPMEPYTMARNFFHMNGGTKADFTAEQFAKSIIYWNNNMICLGKDTVFSRIKRFWQKLIFNVKSYIKY
jgi:hypothetical protein